MESTSGLSYWRRQAIEEKTRAVQTVFGLTHRVPGLQRALARTD